VTAEEGPTGIDFLSLFDPDPAAAETKVLQLRNRLIAYFRWRKCSAPEDLAAETMSRAVKRISDGASMNDGNPVPFIYGIARNVMLEDRESSRRRPAQESIDDHAEPLTNDADGVEAHIELEQVLALLSPTDRDVLLRYVGSDRSSLRDELKTTNQALRTRVCRIRDRLRMLQRRAGPDATKGRV
jgi:RNA polymerase sigma-70 factor, ECF subfamily